ncbi:MAG: extracellular solute-binding protein [Propionibacteriaceae bacterium]|nr:extracellular solute-binding protein [Propionibacteriaceae bacterium]
MNRRTPRRAACLGAAIFSFSLALTGCGTSNDGAGDTSTSPDGEEQIVLTVGTFNNFGYDTTTATMQGADLYNKYMDEHPGIKIEATVAATSDEARSAFNTALGAGSGAYDIQAVDVDWMPDMIKNADKLTDLSDVIPAGRFLDWKTAQATTADGKLIGAGTDIGPEGICYRADLFEAAGLPSDRAEVATLLGGKDATWDKYFEVGAQFVASSNGVAWFDSAAATFQGMINQVEASYVDPDSGDVIASDNAEVKALYDQLLEASASQSASLKQWSDDWSAGFKSDKFATMLCPAWIINNIKNSAGADFVGWDIADVFPGGGGNWGGSFLVIPAQSEHPAEAKALVEWLTAPEQQALVFTAASNFPSAVQAEADPAVTSKTDSFLNNAPVGEIFADRAAAVTVVPYKGSSYFDIQAKMVDAINRVDVDKVMDAAASYTQWLDDVKALA